MAELFDMGQRALRRQRAARFGPELFLHERAFADCLERIAMLGRRFERALLIGGIDPQWRDRLGDLADAVDLFDGVEDHWEPRQAAYDLVLTLGTLDTVNDLPLALRLIHHACRPGALFIGAMSGGDTLPRLRAALRAADALAGAAAPHVHPRIEPSSLAPLLEHSGFEQPVVDIDRVEVSYPSLARLIADLRAMAASNILNSRPRFITRAALAAMTDTFENAGENGRTKEYFEIVHWSAFAPGSVVNAR